jgi:hypothetical protein
MFCDDISEFESYMASHAVGPLPRTVRLADLEVTLDRRKTTTKPSQRRKRGQLPNPPVYQGCVSFWYAPQPAIFWSGGRTGWGLARLRGGATAASGLAMTPTGTGGS